jgi:hypothetical protein
VAFASGSGNDRINFAKHDDSNDPNGTRASRQAASRTSSRSKSVDEYNDDDCNRESESQG